MKEIGISLSCAQALRKKKKKRGVGAVVGKNPFERKQKNTKNTEISGSVFM